MLLPHHSHTPSLAPHVFIAPTAVVIGNVEIGEGASVWYGAVLRGDHGRIVIGRGSNVQDNATIHAPEGGETIIKEDVTIGHGAVLHGCEVRRGALVGMNCVVNDNAEVGEDAMVAALAFVKAESRIPPRSLAAGIPARILRELTHQELQWKKDNMLLYQQLASRSASTMREVEALTEAEPGRKRIDIPGSIPLSELKKKHG